MKQRGLDFIFNLIDRVSGPARKVQQAWRNVSEQARNASNRVANSMASMSRSMERPTLAGRLLQATFLGIGTASRALDGARARAAALTSSIGALRAMALAVPMIIAGGAIGKAAGTAISAVSGKENTMIAFQMLTQDTDAAQQMWDDVMNYAELTPFETDTVVRNWQRLLVSGFDNVEIPIMLSAVGDLAALEGMDEGIIDQVTSLFSRIGSMGRMATQEFRSLEAAGVNSGLMLDTLAELLGVTSREEVEKLMSAGLVDAQTGIVAALTTLQNTVSGGTIGSGMQRYSRSIQGLWGFVLARPGDVLRESFKGFDAEGNAIEDAGYASLRRFLENVVDATDTETDIGGAVGERIRQIYSDVLSSVFDPLAEITDPTVIQGNVERIFDSIEEGMEWIRTNGPGIVAVLSQFFTGFMAGARLVGGAVNWLLGRVRTLGTWLSDLFGINADGIGSFANVAGAVAGVMVAFRLLNLVTMGFARSFMVAAFRIAAGWIIAMGPIGWIILAVIALGGILVWAYNEFEWFRDLVNNVWEGIKTVAIAAWDGIKNTATAAWDAIKGIPASTVSVFTDWWEGVKTAAVSAWNAISAGIMDKWDAIKAIPDTLRTIFTGVWDGFQQATQDAWAEILSFIQPAIDAVGSFIDTVTGWFGGAGTKMDDILTDPATVTVLAESTMEGVAATVPTVATPGGIPSGSPAAAALGAADPRVMPIWQATAAFDQDVTRQLVAGWTSGIYGSEHDVLRAFEDLTGRTITAVEGAYEIHSPSRVFQRLGAMVGAGFINGLTSTHAGIDRAVSGITDQTVDPSAVAPVATTSTSGFSLAGSRLSVEVTIKVNSDQDPATAGREAADAFVDQLTDALEDLATSEGA